MKNSETNILQDLRSEYEEGVKELGENYGTGNQGNQTSGGTNEGESINEGGSGTNNSESGENQEGSEENSLDEAGVEGKQSSDGTTSQGSQVIDDDYDFFKDIGFEEVNFEITDDTDLEELASVIRDNIAKIASDSGIDDQEVKDFRDFKRAGGSLEEFKSAPKRVNYAEQADQLTNDNIDISEQVARYDLQTKGLDDDAIDSIINTYKDTGKLIEKAQSVLKHYDKINEQEYNEWKESIDNAAKQNNELRNTQIKEAKTFINKGVFSGTVINKDESQDFHDFIFKTDKAGNSRLTESYENTTVEQQLLLDLIRYHNFDLSKVKQTERFTKVNTPKRTIGRYIGGGRGGGKTSSRTAQNNANGLEAALDNLFNKQK